MVRVIIVVREAGDIKPDYSLHFDLPEVPRIGSYISIQRPDKRKPFGEDLIVRHVWWRLNHPETAASYESGKQKIGDVEEIFVECDPAIGPYSSDQWRRSLEVARTRGNVQEFEVARLSVSEAELEEIAKKG